MLKSSLLAATLSCLLLNSTRADILFDNGNHVQTGAADSLHSGFAAHESDSFVLPLNATLTGITWKGFWEGLPTNPPDNFEIFIYPDDGTGKPVSPPPSSAIYSAPATLSDTQLTGEMVGPNAIYQYTASVPFFSLSGGTKYWLDIFDNVQTNTNDWFWAIDTNVPGGQMYFANVPILNTWKDNGFSSTTTFQLIGTPTPEPSTLALLALGSLGLLARRRFIA